MIGRHSSFHLTVVGVREVLLHLTIPGGKETLAKDVIENGNFPILCFELVVQAAYLSPKGLEVAEVTVEQGEVSHFGLNVRLSHNLSE